MAVDPAAQLRRRQERLEQARAHQRELLQQRLVHVAAELQDAPWELGRYLAELQEQGRLSTEACWEALARVAASGGRDLVDRLVASPRAGVRPADVLRKYPRRRGRPRSAARDFVHDLGRRSAEPGGFVAAVQEALLLGEISPAEHRELRDLSRGAVARRTLDPTAVARLEPFTGRVGAPVQVSEAMPSVLTRGGVNAAAFGDVVVAWPGLIDERRGLGLPKLAHELVHVRQHRVGGMGDRIHFDTGDEVEDGAANAAETGAAAPDAGMTEDADGGSGTEDASGVDPAVVALVDEAKAVSSDDDACALLKKIADQEGYGDHGLEGGTRADIVAALDAEEGLVERLLELAGDTMWAEGDVDTQMAALTVLEERDFEKNKAALTAILKVTKKGEFKLKKAEAERAWMIMSAMDDASREEWLDGKEGKAAFEAVQGKQSVELMLSDKFRWFDGDVAAVTEQLRAEGAWEAANRDELEKLLWMIVQAGAGNDPEIQQLIEDNWDEHGDYFEAKGFQATSGGLAYDEDITLQGDGQMHYVNLAGYALTHPRVVDAGFGVGLGGIIPIRRKRTLKNIKLTRVQKGMGGHIGGFVFSEDEDPAKDEGRLTVVTDTRSGTLEVDAKLLPFAAFSYQGGTMTITGGAGEFVGLDLQAGWLGHEEIADGYKVHLDSITFSDLVYKDAERTVTLKSLTLSDMNLSGDVLLGDPNNPPTFRDLFWKDGDNYADPASPKQARIWTMLSGITDVCLASIDVLLASYTGLSSGESDADEGTLSEFINELTAVIDQKYPEGFGLTLNLGGLSLGEIEDSSARSAAGCELENVQLDIASGPRALAQLEIARIRAAARPGPLSEADQARVEELARLGEEAAGGDEEADIALTNLGMDTEAVKLELSTNKVTVTGIDTPGMETAEVAAIGEGVEEGQVLVRIDIPGSGINPLPEAQIEPMYTLNIDIPTFESAAMNFKDQEIGPFVLVGVTGQADVMSDTKAKLNLTVDEIQLDGLGLEMAGFTIVSAEPVTVTKLTLVDAMLTVDKSEELKTQHLDVSEVDVQSIALTNLEVTSAKAKTTVVSAATLNGLNLKGLELANGADKKLTIDATTLGDFAVSLASGLSVSSDDPLSVGTIDLESLEAGGQSYSLQDLTTGDVEVETGSGVTVVRLDGVSTALTQGEDGKWVLTVGGYMEGEVSVGGQDLELGVGMEEIRVETSNWADLSVSVNVGPVTVAGFTTTHEKYGTFTVPSVVVDQVTAEAAVTLKDMKLSELVVKTLGVPTVTVPSFAYESLDGSVKVDLMDGHQATLSGLTATGLTIQPGDGDVMSWITAGEAGIMGVSTGRIKAELEGETGLVAEAAVKTGQWTLEKLADEAGVGFAIADLQVADTLVDILSKSGTGFFAFMLNGQPYDASVGEVSFKLTPGGVQELEVKDATFPHGYYTDGNLTITFDEVAADVLRTNGGDLTTLDTLDLKGLAFEILDLTKLTGSDNSSASDVQGSDVDQALGNPFVDLVSGHFHLDLDVVYAATLPNGVEVVSTGVTTPLVVPTAGREEITTNIGVRANVAGGSVEGTCTTPGGHINVPFRVETDTWLEKLNKGEDIRWVQEQVINGVPEDQHLVALELAGVRATQWTPDEIAAEINSFLDEPATDMGFQGGTITHLDVDLSANPETLPLGEYGSLTFDTSGSEPVLRVTASDTNASELTITLDIRPSEASLNLPKGFTLTTGGIELDNGVELALEMNGLSPGSLRGKIESGRISMSVLEGRK